MYEGKIVDTTAARTLVVELAHSFGMRLSPMTANDDYGRTAILSLGTVEARLAMAKAWLQARDCRDKLLDADLFSDPAWDIMLDLYEKHCEGRVVTVTSACIAGRVPTATAFRYLCKLDEAGWINRHEDTRDRRKVLVALSIRAIAAMDALMDAALTVERKLALASAALS